MKNDMGEVIFAQADYYGEITNSIAEARALLQGIELCEAMGFNKIDIEVDSLMLVQAIKKMTRVPWVIAYEMRMLRTLLQRFEYSIKHVYRECNKVADLVANIGVKEKKHLIFGKESLPKKLIGIVRIDRAGLADLRFVKL